MVLNHLLDYGWFFLYSVNSRTFSVALHRIASLLWTTDWFDPFNLNYLHCWHTQIRWAIFSDFFSSPSYYIPFSSSMHWLNSELLDTFFIIIHKKPLILLHWYHHISVLAYCWVSYVNNTPPGIIFCAMNYAVHAIMYFYYFLMAVKLKPKWFNSYYITVAQISQMVVGVIVTVLGFIIPPMYGKECALKKENNIAAMIMYGSYLLLFLQFFFKRYTTKKGGVSNKNSTKEE